MEEEKQDDIHLFEEKIFVVIHALERIGESAKHVPAVIISHYSQVRTQAYTMNMAEPCSYKKEVSGCSMAIDYGDRATRSDGTV